jgi:hypothetical protein
MVTAEFAVGILAVIPVMLSLVLLMAAAAVQMQVLEAARTGARMLARGETPDAVRDQVTTAVPGAEVAVSEVEDKAEVRVSRPMGGLGVLPQFTVSATARTPVEDL